MRNSSRTHINANAMEDMTRLAIAKSTISKLGDTFTKKEYEAIKPKKSTTIEWLAENSLITLAEDETFEKEVSSYDTRYTEKVMVLADGRTLCTENEWRYLPQGVKHTLTRANGKDLTIENRTPTETITCHRYHWKWNEDREVELVERWINHALEYAELKLNELEPKVAKFKAVIEAYAEI